MAFVDDKNNDFNNHEVVDFFFLANEILLQHNIDKNLSFYFGDFIDSFSGNLRGYLELINQVAKNEQLSKVSTKTKIANQLINYFLNEKKNLTGKDPEIIT
jgi:hypothetical protein